MTEYRDLSQLPEDAGYWDALEARVLGAARPRIGRSASASRSVWAPLAERAGALVGMAAAASLAALLLVPARPGTTPTAVSGLLRVPTDDPTLTFFLTSAEPPPVASLVLPNLRRNP
jgi:hypothetical protein